MEHQYHNNNPQTGTIYSCPMHPEIRQDKPGNCPICGMNLVLAEKPVSESHQEIYTTEVVNAPEIQYQLQKYTCPMHPHILQDAPGKCPLCGMTLEPVVDNTHGKHTNDTGMIADFRKRFYVVLALT